MNALQEANIAIDKFLKEYDSCATCAFWTPQLIGGICDGPEIQNGYMEDDTLTCENHEFKDKELEKQINALGDKWYNAWYIVEGFLYESPPEGSWEAIYG